MNGAVAGLTCPCGGGLAGTGRKGGLPGKPEDDSLAYIDGGGGRG